MSKSMDRSHRRGGNRHLLQASAPHPRVDLMTDQQRGQPNRLKEIKIQDMARGLFPSEPILRQLEESNQTKAVFDDLADIVNAEVSSFGSTKHSELICLGFLRASAQGQLDALDCTGELRKAVFNAVFNFKLVRNAAVETLWDVVQVFGPKNLRSTVRYLDAAPPMSAQKLKRLLCQVAQHDTILDLDAATPQLEHQALERSCLGLAVVLASSMAQQFDSEWKRQVRTATPVGKAFYAAANKYAVTPDQKALITMFPQMSLARARKLLESSDSLEEISRKLLDNPKLIDTHQQEQAVKKRFVKQRRDSHGGHRQFDENLAKKTMELVQAMYDDMDEPDDEPEASELEHAVVRLPGEGNADVSAADHRVAQRQEKLHELFKSNPDMFSRQARKTKQRQSLKQQLDWTDEQIEGFASMMQRDPRLRERVQIEDRLARRQN